MLGDTVTAKQALTKLGNLGEENPTEQRNVDTVDRMVSDSQQAYQSKDYLSPFGVWTRLWKLQLTH